VRLLELANVASGVQISSAPTIRCSPTPAVSDGGGAVRDSQERILGAIGVIGPTRLNYARIIPLVDYTARTIGRLVG